MLVPSAGLLAIQLIFLPEVLLLMQLDTQRKVLCFYAVYKTNISHSLVIYTLISR